MGGPSTETAATTMTEDTRFEFGVPVVVGRGTFAAWLESAPELEE